MSILKRGLISLGIACLISAPISRGMMLSQNVYHPIEFNNDEEVRTVEWSAIVEGKKYTDDSQNVVFVDSGTLSKAQDLLDFYGVEVPEDIRIMCEEAQEECNVCAELLEAIGFKESRYKVDAENKGCSGVMQISTRWHKERMQRLGVKDINDPQGNIRVAADYLAELFKKYDGDLYKVLMTYNGDTSEGVSDYAIEIAEISAALERIHGK